MSSIDFGEAPVEAIAEVHRQGEACLNGTIQLALAADLRATTMAGIFGAGSVAIVAAIATVLAGSNPSSRLVVAGAVTSAFLFLAALFCAWAARPTDFYVAGYEPRKLAKAATEMAWMLQCASEDIQVRIDANRRALAKSSHHVRAGALCALIALPAGLIAFFLLKP